MESSQNMKVVARRTGLSPHVLRIWEKRYQVVQPVRTATNRRLYSERDVEKLELLARLTGQGHGIGGIAQLGCDALREMLAASGGDPTPVTRESSARGGVAALVSRTQKAVREMDHTGLVGIFDEASLGLGYSGLLEQILVPLLSWVGEEWQAGRLTAGAEHLASAVIKDHLAFSARGFSPSANAPVLVVGTPAGQLHEMGAVLAANLARKEGWNVVYLGASLPADELAGAVVRLKAQALALSVVYPPDDPLLGDEFRRLRKLLPALPLLVGGRSAGHYAEVLDEIGALVGTSLSELRGTLQSVDGKAKH